MIVEYEGSVVQQIVSAQRQACAESPCGGRVSVTLSLAEARRMLNELTPTYPWYDPARHPAAAFEEWLLRREHGLDAGPQPEVKVMGVPIKVLR